MVSAGNAAMLQGRQDSGLIYAGAVMNNTDRFLTGKKNEAPLSKTGPCESSDARCPFERARVLSKVYVAFLICITLSEQRCDERLRYRARGGGGGRKFTQELRMWRQG